MRKLTLFALLAALITGAVFVTTAYAAGYVVNSAADDTTDDAFCTLREAINAANNTGGSNTNCGALSAAADTITFSVSGTITLGSQLPNIVSGNGALTIDGGDSISISGNDTVRVFQVDAGATLNLENITVRQGFGSAAALATQHGGGVLNNGTINITDTTFSNNWGASGAFGNSRGGAIYSTGTVTITDSTFTGNHSNSGSGQHGMGGAIYIAGGTLTIDETAFSGNFVQAQQFGGGGSAGGAIWFGGSQLTVIGTTFSGNTAPNNGPAQITGYGGAIYAGGKHTITDSIFTGNSAYVGGAIRTDNVSTGTITGSTFSGNSATSAGAISSYIQTLTIANSTFYNNSDNGTSAAVVGGNATIINSTISGNNGNAFSDGTVTLRNTIIANNTLRNCALSSVVSDGGNNIQFGGTTSQSCGATIMEVDPDLGALTGSPAYFPLNDGSPAIDAGSDANCAAAPVNNESQNGVTRPADGDGNGTDICDIGSYEKGAPPPPTPTDTPTDIPTPTDTPVPPPPGQTSYPIPPGNNWFSLGPVRVGVREWPNDETNCRAVTTEQGGSGQSGFSLDDVVYDVKVICDSGEVHFFYAEVIVCMPPSDGVTANKQLFHRQDGASSFTPLPVPGPQLVASMNNPSAVSGYVCGLTTTFSLFTLGELSLPDTGFPPDTLTQLVAQPADGAYTDTELTLEIPSLGVDLDIVGVPLVNEDWDVSWLSSSQAGYLYGTAFPGWEGNSVLTAHVWNANNRAGPFYHLKDLQYGDQFYIHAFGYTYTYEVRSNRLVSAQNLSVMKDSDYSLITLITCESFSESSGEYLYRRAVQAVLVDVTD